MEKIEEGGRGRARHRRMRRNESSPPSSPSKNPVHPVHPANPVKIPAAFSLIEVVLALGVISFAIVGIMGLFPVALRTAQESQRETRATLIARQIFTDLEAGPATNTLIALGTNLGLPANFRNVSLSTSWAHTVNYDSAGAPTGIGADAEFAADISCAADVPAAGLSRVQVNVCSPAQGALRTTNTFVTLMRQ